MKFRKSTIGKYSANCDDPRVDDVLDALFDVVRSRTDTQWELVSRGLKKETYEEKVLRRLRQQLDASPLPVVEAFVEKVKSVVDLEVPSDARSVRSSQRVLGSISATR